MFFNNNSFYIFEPVFKYLELNNVSYIDKFNFNYINFFYYELPHPETFHFHVPEYYLYSIAISIFIGLIFLAYFAVKFGREKPKLEKKAYDKMQIIMAKRK